MGVIVLSSVPSSPINLGNIPQAVGTNFSLTLVCSANPPVTPSTNITAVTPSTAEIVLDSPAVPFTVAPSRAVNFTITPIAAGSQNWAITFASSSTVPNPFIVRVTANVVAPITGGILTCTSGSPPLPLGQAPITTSNTPVTFIINVQNTGTADFHITAISFPTGNPPFSLDATNPSLPIDLPPGGPPVGITIDFDPTSYGGSFGEIQFTTDLASPQNEVSVALSGLNNPFIPVSILTGATRAIIIGFSNTPLSAQGVILQLAQGIANFNFAGVGTLVFNGELWNSPGQEKTLERLEIFYENLGVCTGLVASVTVLRPSIAPNSFQTVTDTINIGSLSADGSDRSAYFDLTASGEIAVLTLTRPAGAGPCSITAIGIAISDRGEKVENV
jgi:hypothetical protein